MRPDRSLDPRGLSGRHQVLRRGRPGTCLGHRRRLVDGLLPGRGAECRASRPAPSRPAGLPAQPRPPLRLGEQPRARARGHRCQHARSRRRAHRARLRRPAHRCAARGRDGAGRLAGPRPDLARPDRGAAHRTAPSPLRRHRRLAGRAGRRRSRHAGLAADLPRGTRLRSAHREGRPRPVVGPRPWPGAAARADLAPRPGRSGRAGRGQREADAGRRLRDAHGRHARPLPRLPRPSHRQPRALLHPGRGSGDVRRGAGRQRVPGAHPRARSATAWTRSSTRGRSTGPAVCATIWPTSRSSTRPTSLGSPSSRSPPTSSRCGRAGTRRWRC